MRNIFYIKQNGIICLITELILAVIIGLLLSTLKVMLIQVLIGLTGLFLTWKVFKLFKRKDKQEQIHKILNDKYGIFIIDSIKSDSIFNLKCEIKLFTNQKKIYLNIDNNGHIIVQKDILNEISEQEFHLNTIGKVHLAIALVVISLSTYKTAQLFYEWYNSTKTNKADMLYFALAMLFVTYAILTIYKPKIDNILLKKALNKHFGITPSIKHIEKKSLRFQQYKVYVMDNNVLLDIKVKRGKVINKIILANIEG